MIPIIRAVTEPWEESDIWERIADIEDARAQEADAKCCDPQEENR